MPKQNPVISILSNVRLTIILLIVITLASILGTLIPQNLHFPEYVELYGPEKAKLILKLGLIDLYHTPGFIVLLSFLAINLIACTWKRGLSRLGPTLTHVSILVILLGGVVGAISGFSGMLILHEGEQASEVSIRKSGEQIPLGFRVRLNRFIFEQYPNGMPKEYRSEVTLLDNQGRKIRDAHIRVNHPIKQNGITLYQSTYGMDPQVELEVTNHETGETVLLKAALHSPVDLPGGEGDQAVVAQFTQDFQPPERMRQMTSFPHHMGPAAKLRVRVKGEVSDFFWVFQRLPEHGRNRVEPYQFTLKDFSQAAYTGLEAARDPGTSLIWLGCILLMVGTTASFWRKMKKPVPKEHA